MRWLACLVMSIVIVGCNSDKPTISAPAAPFEWFVRDGVPVIATRTANGQVVYYPIAAAVICEGAECTPKPIICPGPDCTVFGCDCRKEGCSKMCEPPPPLKEALTRTIDRITKLVSTPIDPSHH